MANGNSDLTQVPRVLVSLSALLCEHRKVGSLQLGGEPLPEFPNTSLRNVINQFLKHISYSRYNILLQQPERSHNPSKNIKYNNYIVY
jgi:hypothetical protein